MQFHYLTLQGAISDTDVLAALSGGNTKVGCIKL